MQPDAPPAPHVGALGAGHRPAGVILSPARPPHEAPGLLSRSPRRSPASAPHSHLLHPDHPRDSPSLQRHPGGRGSGAKPKAVLPGTLPRQPGLVEREWALEPDCLGLNPSPATGWPWGPGAHLSELGP